MAGVFSSVHDVTTGGLGAAVQTVLRSAGGSASMAVLIQPQFAVDVGGAGQDPCSPARCARSAPITSPRSPRAQVATVTGCRVVKSEIVVPQGDPERGVESCPLDVRRLAQGEDLLQVHPGEVCPR